MKKTLVSALSAALVVGAASTTFAASNPFSDVPADHWAYDAVTQLAADGVIEGYGDTTFQGKKNITRYEMAQMIAKAMAKAPKAGTDKALIDKLAAEFADELNNLGVRVAKLEKNADMVQWHGTAEYTFQHYMTEHKAVDDKDSRNNLLLRLVPTAEVNDHWKVSARLDANTSLDTDEASTAEDKGNVNLKRVWAEGRYGNMKYTVGKFEAPDPDTITDMAFSGAEIAYRPAGDGVFGFVGAGRLSEKAIEFSETAANYQYAGVGFNKSKLMGEVSFNHLNADKFDTNYAKEDKDDANIWHAKGSYRFDKNWAVKGFYAENTEADAFEKAGSAEIDYKGAQAANAGTWGMWVAYRHFGKNAFVSSPWDVINLDNNGEKGWEVGGNAAIFQNTILTLRYGHGKELATSNHVHNLFGRVNFLF